MVKNGAWAVMVNCGLVDSVGYMIQKDIGAGYMTMKGLPTAKSIFGFIFQVLPVFFESVQVHNCMDWIGRPFIYSGTGLFGPQDHVQLQLSNHSTVEPPIFHAPGTLGLSLEWRLGMSNERDCVQRNAQISKGTKDQCMELT